MIKTRTTNNSFTTAQITQIRRVIAVRTFCKQSMANRLATSIWLASNRIFSRCRHLHKKINSQDQITIVCIWLRSRTIIKSCRLRLWIRKSARTSESSRTTRLLSRSPLKKPFSMCKTAWIISNSLRRNPQKMSPNSPVSSAHRVRITKRSKIESL